MFINSRMLHKLQNIYPVIDTNILEDIVHLLNLRHAECEQQQNDGDDNEVHIISWRVEHQGNTVQASLL